MSKQKTEEFLANGMVVVEQLLPKELIIECLNDVKNFSDFERPLADKVVVFEKLDGDKKLLKYFQHLQNYIPSFHKLYCSRLLNMAEQLLQGPVYFANMGMHDKAPLVGTHTPPHQDNFYWCLEPAAALTAYIALEDQSQENGGISYLLGSHKNGVSAHEKGKTAAFSSRLTGEYNLNDFFRPVLKQGDVVFHHANVVHAADPNTSNRNRRAVAISINGEAAKISPAMRAVYEQNRIFNRS